MDRNVNLSRYEMNRAIHPPKSNSYLSWICSLGISKSDSQTKEYINFNTNPPHLSTSCHINTHIRINSPHHKTMGCGCFGTSTPHSMETTRTLKQELVLKIPGCTVHLMDQGEAEELAKGDFTVFRILDENICLATIIKVGDDNEDGLQWPLTKDEPVVKLDSLHYLFSLPIKDGDPLSYGITFRDQCNNSLKSVDSFLKRNCCFSASNRKDVNNIDWKEYAPRIDNYNNFLAKAIAGGTGQIIKGIFICSNAYTNKVQVLSFHFIFIIFLINCKWSKREQ